MHTRHLREGDIIILDNMPTNWKRPGEVYQGMLYERFDRYGEMFARRGQINDYPCYSWRIQWFIDIPPTYDDKKGLSETNIINMTSVKKGTYIPLCKNT